MTLLVATALMMPKHYICHRAETSIVIDGKASERAWQIAPWTDDFVDIEGDTKPKPRFRTRAKMLWDDEYFYVFAEMEEPHVWATQLVRDSVIFHDNDFEIFIDPDGDNHLYYEIEINALNTVWDLLLVKPYLAGGPAVNGWDISGLRHAVFVDGTLNDPNTLDAGWSVEIAIPWKALAECANKSAPPNEGDIWRVNFSRVQWEHEILDGRYRKVEGEREDNWVWSPQEVVDMHRPWMWGFVQFTNAKPGEAELITDETWPMQRQLMQLYLAQREHFQHEKRFASTAAHLGFDEKIQIHISPSGWEASLQIDRSRVLCVNHEARLWMSSR